MKFEEELEKMFLERKENYPEIISLKNKYCLDKAIVKKVLEKHLTNKSPYTMLLIKKELKIE